MDNISVYMLALNLTERTNDNTKVKYELNHRLKSSCLKIGIKSVICKGTRIK